MNFRWVDVDEGAGRTTNTRLIPSILFNCQYYHGSKGYSSYSFAQLSWHSTGENELWMVDLGFSLFPSTFPSLLLKHLQDRTLDGKILFFFYFPSHFPFKNSFQKPARIKIGWVDVEEGAGPTTNTCKIPSILSNFKSVHGSRLYFVYSFAQLSWHSTGVNELWMVRSWFPFFSSHLSFHSFLLTTCKNELWMVRSWIPSFLIPFSFHSFLSKNMQE